MIHCLFEDCHFQIRELRETAVEERLGPFWLAYLEALLRIADGRASAKEEAAIQEARP